MREGSKIPHPQPAYDAGDRVVISNDPSMIREKIREKNETYMNATSEQVDLSDNKCVAAGTTAAPGGSWYLNNALLRRGGLLAVNKVKECTLDIVQWKRM